MVKVGLIGLGKMGMSHCAILNAHPNVELVGVADTSKVLRWGIGKYSSIPVFDDFKKMIDETSPKCVLIATPTRSHLPIAEYCLERNIHLFMEKPCCLNYNDTLALRDLAEKNKLLIQVGYHNRYLGTFREVKKLVEAGALGEIYNFSAESYGPVVIREKAETWRSDRKEGGGCLYDYASHVLNLVGFILGEVKEVRGTRLVSIFSKNVEDAVYSSLALENGLCGQLSVSWSEESYRKMSTRISISGNKGRIEANPQELKFYRNSNCDSTKNEGWELGWLTDYTEPVNFYLRGEEYSSQIDDFIEHVATENLESINSIVYSGDTDRVIELLIDDAQGGSNG